ncbi:MAG TPA: YopJ family acetyltransferase, partial [Burkholderiales bacterium]|nr:YopJ family acetyltransferase [Burkholderiales bacterium]
MNNNDDKDSKASASLPHRDASAKFPEGQSPERPTWSPITEAASPVPPPDVDDQPLEPESPVRPTWSPITVDSPGVAPPLSTEVSPPLDIRKYLEGLILYTELLRTQFKHDVHPRSFFVDIGGEKYLDARIVITNKRADNQARALGNPALQLNLKIANSMDELFQHLEKMRRDDEANLLRAIVPMQNIAGGPKHRVFYEAQKEDGKISLVIREPTTEKAAAALINEFIEHNNNYPGAVHNASVRVTNVQKAAAGCPSFAITDAANHAKDPKDGNRIHDEQLSSPSRKIQLIIDSFGVSLNWRAYLHAQSKGQVTEVVDNPRHADAKLRETHYNNKKETFPQRHENHRVTQDVFALQDGSYEARTFSNSIDYRRLRELDYLVDYIKQLIGEHGEGKAGEIFQQELSAVWLSGHSNEEILGVEHFEPYKEVIEQVC